MLIFHCSNNCENEEKVQLSGIFSTNDTEKYMFDDF